MGWQQSLLLVIFRRPYQPVATAVVTCISMCLQFLRCARYGKYVYKDADDDSGSIRQDVYDGREGEADGPSSPRVCAGFYW